ncbi:dihydroneopterin aldolase [Paraneptunicella aestuarii]|uniref:dihydroneopterin aldolase n=1 Tax=Paraneptunicella aestuarii TaxID=2831148 RepID=UPI001E544FD8|nr:dihydroneopterin aldolase [Paraneptunicella aestuarii]UAA38046.1 dihydroneopterin aldolase [Paraneptunicella aestuarii]
MDKIHIEGLQLFAVIGVYDWERLSPQKLIVDVVLHISLEQAAMTDSLEDTVDYAQVAGDLETLTNTCQPKLLEHLAGKMCQLILENYPVQTVEIKLSKPDILAKANNVAVQMVRSKLATEK